MRPESSGHLAKSGRPWGLIAFWVLILSGTAAGCAYLQFLGPPPPDFESTPVPIKVGPQAAPHPATTSQQAASPTPAPPATLADAAPPLTTPPIAGPNPKLLAASAIDAQWQVPKIAADGAMPMQAYAASQLPPPDAAILPPDVPRVAVVIAGLGDDAVLYQMAAHLPPEFSLALSPYGKNVAAAATARENGHETLLLLPMPGLLAGAPQSQNQATLDWSMAQFQGYAGVTDAFGPAMGGGFMTNAAAKTWLMTNIARQGLFYIEGDPAAHPAPYAAGRDADIVIDASDGPAAETGELAALVTTAESQHAALAIVLNPTPDALDILDNWSATLVNQDILLVPVSALVQPPDVPYKLYASTKQ